MATHSAPTYHRRRETDSGAGFKVIAMLLGLAVAIIGFFALLMWADARNARDDGSTAAPQPASQAAAHEGAADHNTALPIESFAGVVPGEERRRAGGCPPGHRRHASSRPAGDLVKVKMTLKDMVVEVAPGVKYNTWAFDGHGAPGPVVHVREGQTVEMTLVNGGAIPHSIDFHAARIAPGMSPSRTWRRVNPSPSASRPTTPVSTCTTAGRSQYSPTSPTGCTAPSSSTREALAEGRSRVRPGRPASGT